jgi:hypothetical protein
MRRSEKTSNSPNLMQRLRTWLSGEEVVAVERDPEAAVVDTVRRDIDVSLVDMYLSGEHRLAGGMRLRES